MREDQSTRDGLRRLARTAVELKMATIRLRLEIARGSLRAQSAGPAAIADVRARRTAGRAIVSTERRARAVAAGEHLPLTSLALVRQRAAG